MISSIGAKKKIEQCAWKIQYSFLMETLSLSAIGRELPQSDNGVYKKPTANFILHNKRPNDCCHHFYSALYLGFSQCN